MIIDPNIVKYLLRWEQAFLDIDLVTSRYEWYIHKYMQLKDKLDNLVVSHIENLK